MTKFL